MSEQTELLLDVNNLQIGFQSHDGFLVAVDGVDFQIKRGETFALLGESGCGKSMTALALSQLLPEAADICDGSQISLDNQDLLNIPEVAMRRIRGKRIAMIFQEPMTALNPVLTVGEQIGEVLRCHFKLKGRAQYARTIELLIAVQIPEPKARIQAYPHQLSGGMKQRVMIAMALAAEPDLLIADEPTTALDVTIQAQILALLKSIQQKTQMAMMLITHDLGIVREMADEVAVMYAGHLIEKASCADFFNQPLHPYSQKLFESLPTIEKRGEPLAIIPGFVPPLTEIFNHCRFASRCPYAWQTCFDQIPRFINVANNQAVRCHLYDEAYKDHTPKKAEKSEPILSVKELKQTQKNLLQVKDLKIHFPIQKGLFQRKIGSVKAVDGLSFDVASNQTVALVGESGCGKTTTGFGILKLLEITGGELHFEGNNLKNLKGSKLKKFRKDVQIIFQDPYSSMNPRMLVGDIIAEGMRSLKIYKDNKSLEAEVNKLLEMVGLPIDAKHRYPHEFSGGQRQRICIARALSIKPKLIICDEPTSALDVSVQAQILNLLKRLQQEFGLAYIFITHNISVVAYLAHYIAVMYLGRIVEYGKVEDVLQNPKHPYTQLLLSSVPTIGTKQTKLQVAHGELPSPINPPTGCHFHPRCPFAMEKCRQQYPGTTSLSEDHRVKCYLY